MQEQFYGAVEAGGTKVNLAVGSGPTDIVDSARVETTTPEVTIAAILEFNIGVRRECATHGFAYERLIVDQEHANPARRLGSGSLRCFGRNGTRAGHVLLLLLAF